MRRAATAHLPAVAADDALALLLGTATDVPGGGVGKAPAPARPWARRHQQCVTCGHRTAYAVTWRHWCADQFRSCGPYCTGCSGAHLSIGDA